MIIFDQIALLLLILVPLFGAFLMTIMSKDRPKDIWYFAIFIASMTLVISIVVFCRYDYHTGGSQLANSFNWLDKPLKIELSLGIDGISAPLVLLNGIVLMGAVLISQTINHRPRDFFVLLFALGSGVFGVFVSRDLFFLFFFYELAVLPMYLLIGVWGSSTDFVTFIRTKEYGAMKLMIFLVAGEATFSLELLSELSRSGQFDSTFQNWVFPLFMIGFGVLAGLWPFHTWSPDGHVAAPTGVSMLHAGVLMKLGAYGIIVVGIVLLPEGAASWAPVLIILGTVNVIYGAMSAISQKDLKYIIGYSSVSHMGYVLMGIATLHPVGMAGGVLQMFSHGIMTALMFAMVGAIYERSHIRDIFVLNGLMKKMGVASVFFAVAGLASLGLPGLSGFIAEFMVFVGAFSTYWPLAVVAVIGAAITAVYILRLLARSFFGELDPEWDHLTDASPVEKVVGGAFVLILIAVGIWPAPLLDVINNGVAAVLLAL